MTSPAANTTETGKAPASRVLLLGLDGASWRLLDPLMEDGKLPRLAQLISEGARGVLESTIPPVTASAWSSLYTGRSPGRHGVFDFRRRMGPDTTHRPWVTLGEIGGPRLWDIASAQGKTVGLINLPLTFPPVPVKGYMIGGMPVPPTKDEIGLPSGLVDEIVSRTGEYISDVDLLRGESPDVNDPEKCREFVLQVGRAAESRGRAALYLIDEHPTDLTACVLVTPDRLSHLFWKVLVPEPGDQDLKRWEVELRERMIEVLGTMDGVVGRLVDAMSADDLVILVSDHGFGHLDEILKLNRLLRRLGYLKFRPEVEGGLRRKVGRLLPESIKKPVREFMRWKRMLRRGHAQDAHATAGDTAGERKPFDPYALIDWSQTRAYSGGSVEQGVFLNVAGREPMGTVQMGGEYHRVRDRLIEDLRKSIHPSDRKPLFDWVEPRENVYSGEYLDNAPDIIFSLREYRMVVGEDAEPPLVGPWSQPRAGFHRRDGIVVLAGPMIRKGIQLGKSRIEDVAPTLLACWGLAADEGMDGEVMRGAIEPEFLVAHPARRADFADHAQDAHATWGLRREPCERDAEDMEDLLKGLGYLN